MDWSFEEQAKAAGFRSIAGVDEAGRGPLAGPVIAAACILPGPIPGIDDSKKLTPKKREALYDILTTHPGVTWAVGLCTPAEIDQINILQAALLSMIRAVEGLPISADYLLIDGNKSPKTPIPSEPIVKGDGRSPSIAAASIIAKETRDRLMLELDRKYPGYGFAIHKGYPTKAHLNELKLLGPSPIHRMTFAPLKNLAKQ